MTARTQRRGRNRGGYGGETIDVRGVLARAEAAGARLGWTPHPLGGEDGLARFALVRQRPGSKRCGYVSTGIHGDEPAGPMALVRRLESDQWPVDLDLWLCPCLNPGGFLLNRRENPVGRDLNRDYRHLEAPEVKAHVAWLAAQPRFDVAICLHEDWEAQGFYLYELNPDGLETQAEAIIEGVGRVCPIDPSAMIDGREARGGIIRPQLDPAARPQWPEAFYLLQHKTRHSYTFEAPSDFELEVRIQALDAALEVALGCARGRLDRPGAFDRLRA